MRARELVLGRDHPDYGVYRLGESGDAMAWAISAGRDSASPALRSKGDPARPNEDALLFLDDGARRLLAVADGHFGNAASHGLLAELAEWSDVPSSAEALDAAMGRLTFARGWRGAVPSRERRAGTSLALVILEASERRAFGLRYGDSTIAALGPRGHRTFGSASPFVYPARPDTLDPRGAGRFEVRLDPEDALLVYSDGVDACHYGHPETSLRPRHFEFAWRAAAGEPRELARCLVELALAGVDGNPGGEDNVALVILGHEQGVE